jgi:hypothetical protein
LGFNVDLFQESRPALMGIRGVMIHHMELARLKARLPLVVDDDESWLGLSEQESRVDKWNVCQVQAAAICGSHLK